MGQRLDHPIRQILYINLKESMQNGGGPACLRLRVALTPQEYQAVNPHVMVDDLLKHGSIGIIGIAYPRPTSLTRSS